MKPIAFGGFLFFLLLLCISCNNDAYKPEQSIFSLDKTEIVFEPAGGEIRIVLTTNSDWTTDDIPDWISLDHTSGNTTQQITITTEANDDTQDREAEIIFANNYEKMALSISQAPKKRELAWSSLVFSSFDNVNFILGENNIERIYSFTARQMFITHELDQGEKIFVGNLVNRKLNDNTDIIEYPDYTFNPITVFPLTGMEKSRTYVPSKAEQDAFAAQIIEKKPVQNEKFVFDGIGIEYGSHRELSLIGRGNMGISLDEIVSGKSYREQEMVKKNGIIFSFAQTLFTFAMDLQDRIVKEDIDKNDFPDNGLSYISSVSYGRIGLLIIESGHSAAKIRTIVNKILQNNSHLLSHDETAILDEINAYHLYIDKSQGMMVTKGQSDAIEAYGTQITNDRFNVFPFKFAVSDYFEHANIEMTFHLRLL